MSYNYAPPPPPPPQASAPAYHHPQTYNHQGSRGGNAGSRGRGGHYSGHQPDYNAPQAQPPPQYEYSAHQYPTTTPASYGTSPASPYPTQQWHPDHTHSHLGQHPHTQAGHAAASVSANPYSYPPAVAYGQPQYPQLTYGQTPTPYHPQQYPAATHTTAPNQWPAQQVPHTTYNRGRGGYSGDRGGRGLHLQGNPSRVASDGVEPPNSYPPHYDGRPNGAYPPPPYQYAPPPPPRSHGAVPRFDGNYAQGSRRGRGGHHDPSQRGKPAFRGDRHHNHASKKPHQKEQQAQQVAKPAKNDKNDKNEAQAMGKKKKRKVNTLGLTPGDDEGSGDDEEEETLLRDLIGVEAIHISNMAAYIAERRKRFPTAARIEAKKVAELAKKTDDDEATRLEKEAVKLRRQLKKVESSIKRKREQQDEGDEMRDPSSDEESSDDGSPEVMSSRADQNPLSPESSAKRADISMHCKYYSTGGSCGKKVKCRFKHDPAVREAALREKEANNGQMTIKQRLILNDKEQEDLTVLESIQYLRDKGIMKHNKGIAKGPNPEAKPRTPKPETVAVGSEASPPTTSTPPVAQIPGNSLPPPPLSLPPPPIRREVPNPFPGGKNTGSQSHRGPPNGGNFHKSKDGKSKDKRRPYDGWKSGGHGNIGGGQNNHA